MRTGFTLVEVLVALLIFSLIAAAGVGVLSLTIDNRFAVQSATRRTAELQVARALIRADLGQAADRRVRDDQGRPERQSMSGGEGDLLLALTRRGWTNPAQAPRAAMQRVEYRLVDGRLERRVRTALDGGGLGPAKVLAQGVQAARIGFIAEGRETPVWNATSGRRLPDAVRIDLTLEDQGRVSQLFLVGGA